MSQVYNPYLPSWEYVPDGEPYVFNNRLYVYGSHDRFNGDIYCMEPYVCWSASIHDLSDWTYHGVIYDGKEDVLNKGNEYMFAPDLVENNKNYYLYYGLESADTISVAVSDKPEGPFKFYGNVHHASGEVWGRKAGDKRQFDPGIFKDDDGRIYLYSGFSSTPEVIERIKNKMRAAGVKEELNMTCEGSWVCELEQDMLTLKGEVKPLIPGVENSKGTGFEGHEFFEASSMRKFNGKYYAIYSSVLGHELCYAMSDYPDRDFEYKGILHSNGNIGLSEQPLYYYANNHGSIVEIKGNYYIFGHRHTNYTQYQRQGVAERLIMNSDGTFNQAEMTSCGLNNGPLNGKGVYPTYIASVLMAKQGACKADTKIDRENNPAITQDENKEAFITNIQDGTIIGFKYFDFNDLNGIRVEIKASDDAVLEIKTNLADDAVGNINIAACSEWKCFENDIKIEDGINALYFIYKGKGKLAFKSYELY